jgi:hypothetical protein
MGILPGAQAARIEMTAADDSEGQDQPGRDCPDHDQAPPDGGDALLHVHGSTIQPRRHFNQSLMTCRTCTIGA